MNVRHKINPKGFTIIEVVLVLAIAGLIFLMVFIALPALQRSQRDTARKNDVSIVAAAVTSFTSNNRGTFPDTAGLATYVTNKSDNTTEVNVSKSSGAGTISPGDGVVIVTPQSSCGTSTAERQELNSGAGRQFTVVTKLEAGGGAYYCMNG